jgi:hypothetical protein
MATQILASIPNTLTTLFTAEDLNTVQVLGYQIDALKNVICNAAKAEPSDTLTALQTIAILTSFNFADFREELEGRLERRSAR